MSFEIISSVFSFVDFNDPPAACNDGQMALPQVTDFAKKFQFKVKDAPAGFEPWAAPVVGGIPVIPAKYKLNRLCGRMVLPIPFAAFPVTITKNLGDLPLMDDGTYNAPSDLLSNLNSKDQYVWKMDDTKIYTDSCCIPPFNGSLHVTGADSYDATVMFMLEYMYFWANIPPVAMEGVLDIGDCFYYGIYGQDPEYDQESIYKLSNQFYRAKPGCFFTHVEFWNTDDCFDFAYNCFGYTNSAWLPMYLSNPTNPTKESVYKKRLLTAEIDEEYTVHTDRLTQWLHRKIEGMLLHDYKLFTNSYHGLVSQAMLKSAPYDKDWDEEFVNIKTSTAKTKLAFNLANKNSSCCNETKCCTEESPCPDFSFNDIGFSQQGDPVFNGDGTMTLSLGWLPLPASITSVVLKYRYYADPTYVEVPHSATSPMSITVPIGTYMARLEGLSEDGCESTNTPEVVIGSPENISGECTPVGTVTVSGTTSSTVTLQWASLVPDPAGKYSWQLWDLSGAIPVFIAYGIHLNVGATQSLTINGLVPDTGYTFKVRSSCDGGYFSDWSIASPHTTT